MRAIRSSERDGQETLLLEIRDVLEQLWWADWPAISSALEQEIRSLLARLRESEQRRVLVE
jgi:hypothetical protein